MFNKRDAKRLANEAQSRGQDVTDDVRNELKNASGQSCDWVKQNPWSGVGIGAALGLVVGILISKK